MTEKKYYLTAYEVSIRTDYSTATIRQRDYLNLLKKKGFAVKTPDGWRFSGEAIQFLKDRRKERTPPFKPKIPIKQLIFRNDYEALRKQLTQSRLDKYAVREDFPFSITTIAEKTNSNPGMFRRASWLTALIERGLIIDNGAELRFHRDSVDFINGGKHIKTTGQMQIIWLVLEELEQQGHITLNKNPPDKCLLHDLIKSATKKIKKDRGGSR